MEIGATNHDSKEELSSMDELIAQFNESIADVSCAFDSLSQAFTKSLISICKGNIVFSQLSIEVCVLKLYRYKNKLNKASFLTRWYWKRKIFQEIKVIRKYNACVIGNTAIITELKKS